MLVNGLHYTCTLNAFRVQRKVYDVNGRYPYGRIVQVESIQTRQHSVGHCKSLCNAPSFACRPTACCHVATRRCPQNWITPVNIPARHCFHIGEPIRHAQLQSTVDCSIIICPFSLLNCCLSIGRSIMPSSAAFRPNLHSTELFHPIQPARRVMLNPSSFFLSLLNISTYFTLCHKARYNFQLSSVLCKTKHS